MKKFFFLFSFLMLGAALSAQTLTPEQKKALIEKNTAAADKALAAANAGRSAKIVEAGKTEDGVKVYKVEDKLIVFDVKSNTFINAENRARACRIAHGRFKPKADNESGRKFIARGRPRVTDNEAAEVLKDINEDTTGLSAEELKAEPVLKKG